MGKRIKRTYTYTAHAWMFELSFWLIVFIGAAMAVVGIINAATLGKGLAWVTTMCNWVKHVCIALGMIIPAVMSYQPARRKGTTWFVLWIVFVVLVIAGVVLTGIGL